MHRRPGEIFRPDAPIYAFSPDESVVSRSMLLWGTWPILCDRFLNTDMLVDMAEVILEKRYDRLLLCLVFFVLACIHSVLV